MSLFVFDVCLPGFSEAKNERRDPLFVDRNMNFDHNSMTDKKRRAEEITEDEISDTGPIPLWKLNSKTPILGCTKWGFWTNTLKIL